MKLAPSASLVLLPSKKASYIPGTFSSADFWALLGRVFCHSLPPGDWLATCCSVILPLHGSQWEQHLGNLQPLHWLAIQGKRGNHQKESAWEMGRFFKRRGRYIDWGTQDEGKDENIWDGNSTQQVWCDKYIRCNDHCFLYGLIKLKFYWRSGTALCLLINLQNVDLFLLSGLKLFNSDKSRDKVTHCYSNSVAYSNQLLET